MIDELPAHRTSMLAQPMFLHWMISSRGKSDTHVTFAPQTGTHFDIAQSTKLRTFENQECNDFTVKRQTLQNREKNPSAYLR